MVATLLGCFMLLVAGVSAADSDQCDHIGSGAVPSSNLLQVSANKPHGKPSTEDTLESQPSTEDNFGPDSCVGLKRSVTGSCVLRTQCKDSNISATEFAFVCFNPGASMPHALHSFGRGGFKSEETYDTKVYCKTCTSVDTAFRSGSPVVRNALAALPLSHLPSLSGAVKSAPAYSSKELSEFKPKDAAVFGPEYCISTFRAPAGTCLIRTRCPDVDLSKFNVGVTCLDKSGGYTRYLFGKDTFKAEETFDTLISCDKCLGVGKESSLFAMHGLMPRKLVDDVSSLKYDVQTLNEKVRVLSEGSSKAPSKRLPSIPAEKAKKKKNHHEEKHGEADPMGPMPDDPREESELVSQESRGSVPTVMMSRRHTEVPMEDSAEGQVSTPMVAEEAGADSAEVDIGNPPDVVPVVTHRRGAAIKELFRRAQASPNAGD